MLVFQEGIFTSHFPTINYYKFLISSTKVHTPHIKLYTDINYASLINGYKLTNILALESKLDNITKPDASKSYSMACLMNV